MTPTDRDPRTTITIGRVTYDAPANEWAAYVLDCIRDESLAEAGRELMMLATYALERHSSMSGMDDETKQDRAFLADLNTCLVAYWQKCKSEIEAEQVWEEQL